MGVWYCTREDVKAALDFKETARNNAQVDRAIEAASRAVEGCLKRRFYPATATRYFDWPTSGGGFPWRLWLDENDLISASLVQTGTVTISPSQYNLEPANSGPPYTRLELKLSGSAAFGASSSHQRDVSIVGVWGYGADTQAAGTLSEALDDTETAVDVSDSSAVGVGDILLVDSERMIVTAKSVVTTSQTLQADLASQANAVTVAVVTGSAYSVGETILVDSERLLVVDIAGNSLTVRRAWDGSVLAAHTSGGTVYAARTLTVERGALGTTAATHNSSAAVRKHQVPSLVKQFAVAEALNYILQEGSGWARVAGSGDNEREATGRALKDIRKAALETYGRRARTATI